MRGRLLCFALVHYQEPNLAPQRSSFASLVPHATGTSDLGQRPRWPAVASTGSRAKICFSILV